MFHPVSLSLQISLNVLPGPCLGLCVGVACFVGFVGLVVGFFLWGNLISITGSFQLLTDHVSHLSGNAGKKNERLLDEKLWGSRSSIRLVGGKKRVEKPIVSAALNRFGCIE